MFVLLACARHVSTGYLDCAGKCKFPLLVLAYVQWGLKAFLSGHVFSCPPQPRAEKGDPV